MENEFINVPNEEPKEESSKEVVEQQIQPLESLPEDSSSGEPKEEEEEKSKKNLWLMIAAVVLAIIIVAAALIFGGQDKDEEAPVPTEEETIGVEIPPLPETDESLEALYGRYKVMAGHWTGTWKNLTFGSTGTIEADVEVNPDGTGQVVADIDGMVFGIIDPGPKTFPATYNNKGGLIELTDDLFGKVQVSVDKDGNLQGHGLSVPAPGVDSVTVGGKVTAESAELTYIVNFTGGGSANGEIKMGR